MDLAGASSEQDGADGVSSCPCGQHVIDQCHTQTRTGVGAERTAQIRTPLGRTQLFLVGCLPYPFHQVFVQWLAQATGNDTRDALGLVEAPLGAPLRMQWHGHQGKLPAQAPAR
jgi:hypothetical protein